MTNEEMKTRTKTFALRILTMAGNLPPTTASRILSKQLIRCATSVGANYRAACRAKSRPDFLAKMKICEEEADECQYWLELLTESGLIKKERLESLYAESKELTAIISAACKTTRTSP